MRRVLIYIYETNSRQVLVLLKWMIGVIVWSGREMMFIREVWRLNVSRRWWRVICWRRVVMRRGKTRVEHWGSYGWAPIESTCRCSAASEAKEPMWIVVVVLLFLQVRRVRNARGRIESASSVVIVLISQLKSPVVLGIGRRSLEVRTHCLVHAPITSINKIVLNSAWRVEIWLSVRRSQTINLDLAIRCINPLLAMREWIITTSAAIAGTVSPAEQGPRRPTPAPFMLSMVEAIVKSSLIIFVNVSIECLMRRSVRWVVRYLV